jgi:hypothetical protein
MIMVGTLLAEPGTTVAEEVGPAAAMNTASGALPAAGVAQLRQDPTAERSGLATMLRFPRVTSKVSLQPSHPSLVLNVLTETSAQSYAFRWRCHVSPASAAVP